MFRRGVTAGILNPVHSEIFQKDNAMLKDPKGRSIPCTVEEFFSILARSALIPEQQGIKLIAHYRDEYLTTSKLPDTITAFCDFLVTRMGLTVWQCAKLRNGQYKGFIWNNFVILDMLDADEKFSYYLARDTADGKCVRLGFTLPNRPDSTFQVIERY
jgi:hypothetical protein